MILMICGFVKTRYAIKEVSFQGELPFDFMKSIAQVLLGIMLINLVKQVTNLSMYTCVL